MFVRNVSDDIVNKLTDLDVVLIDIPAIYDEDYIIDVRWKMFSSFMVEHKDDYDMAFISDIRDVIIQGDIFSWYENNNAHARLIISLENDLISESSLNKEWILRGYGSEVYDKIYSNFAICCGTVCGSINEMILLCDKMDELIHSNDRFWGMEQASFNYLVYSGKISPPPQKITLIASPALAGAVATVGTLDKVDIKGKYIMNSDGSIPAIVHQYDRHPHLLYHVLKNYTKKSRFLLYYKYSGVGRSFNRKQRMIMKPIEEKFKHWFRK